MFPEKIHEVDGDGLVATSVNCKGSVFAYESGGSIKLKQLDQSDGITWSDLADVASSAISMEMSSDVLAVGTTGKVQLYLFANGGTSYDEYKAIDGLSVRPDHLLIDGNYFNPYYFENRVIPYSCIERAIMCIVQSRLLRF